jgi:hypothetical protein
MAWTAMAPTMMAPATDDAQRAPTTDSPIAVDDRDRRGPASGRPPRRHLLFAVEPYALPILRPLERAIRDAGGEACWFLPASFAGRLAAGEQRIEAVKAVRAWRPDVVFAASNWVPHFFPGAKVQVFHGFDAEKRERAHGHFRIRGLFDLYCTQGPTTTGPFLELAAQHGHFAVVETGWPKLDPMYDAPATGAAAMRERPVVLYAATFTEELSSAAALHAAIAAQIAGGERDWLLTLHPKSDPALVARYRALAGAHARYVESDALIDAMRVADVLVSDTSSVISEFVLQDKPVVTFRNRVPKPYMIDVTAAVDLEPALRVALAREPARMALLRAHADAIHPWRDGRSSQRVLAAAEALLGGRYGSLRPKPANLWRKFRMRRDLHYFGPAAG